MKILVTGGSGNVGRGVVRRLADHGHAVRVVDWRVQDPQPGIEYVECDITQFGALREQARGQEAVVHLAAYAFPGAASGPEIFRVNCAGTYNVFEAAAVEGIRRVACASSINALGYNFGVKSFPIRYFPVDEDHPTSTTDPYSFSKQTTEAIAAYYWRRDGISSALLRMPFVYTLNEEMNYFTNLYLEGVQRFIDHFVTLPAGERAAQVDALKARLEQRRATRVWEQPVEGSWDEAVDFNDPAMMAFFGYTDFWSILSVEDAAQAFEKSVLAGFEGSHPLLLSERENASGIESETLLSIFYPEVPERRRPIPGKATLLSYERARQLIGFEPERSLRQQLGKT
jgi:nucleoside-diphosphate-sugar epimerase